MNERHLITFIKCADCGSFSAASRELYLSANSLMQQVDLLEKELGFKLFNRGFNGVTLTEGGALFYAGAKSILTKWETLVEECRGRVSRCSSVKTMLLSSGEIYFLDDMIKTLEEENAARLEFVAYDPAWIQALLSGDCDFIILPDCEPLRRDCFYRKLLCRSKVFCVVSENHLLATKNEISVHDLESYPILLNSAEWIDVLPFLKKHPNRIEYAMDKTVVLNKCQSQWVYLTAEHWAAGVPRTKVIPLGIQNLLEIYMVSRAEDKERVCALFEMLAERFCAMS